MGAPYGLGDFAGQLTADELRNAYASAGGRPDELDFGALPTRGPAPVPAPAMAQPMPENPYPAPEPESAPDMHIAPTPARTGLAGYDRQLLDNQNQRIDLAAQGGAENSAMYDRRAALRGEQAAGIRATNDTAKARIEEGRAREMRHRDEADRLYDDMRAHAMPPDRKAVEKVLGVIGAVMAMGGNHGMAVGASMLGSLIGSDRERWALEQESNSNLYRAALQGVGADQGSQQHEVAMAGNIAALDAHYYEAALEQAKEQGLSAEAKRVATGLQLDLREKGIQALRATRVADMKQAMSARKSSAEEYFWRVPLDQLREMPSQVLGQAGQKVLAERTKQDQGYREGEADIRKKEGAAAGEGAGQEVLPGYVATVPLEKKDVSDIRANAQLLQRIKGNYAKLAEIRERHKGRPLAAWTDRDDVREAGNIISEMTGTLNQFGGRGAPSNAELEDQKQQLLDPTNTYVLTEPKRVYQQQIERLEQNFNDGLNAVGVQRAGGAGRRAPGAGQPGADPRVRPGFAAPSAASRGVSTGLPAGGVTIDQIRAADQQQAQDDAQRDAVQQQLARWTR